jgi:K+ transporter
LAGFRPVTLVWFLAIGATGLHGIAQFPGCLRLNPAHALGFW